MSKIIKAGEIETAERIAKLNTDIGESLIDAMVLSRPADSSIFFLASVITGQIFVNIKTTTGRVRLINADNTLGPIFGGGLPANTITAFNFQETHGHRAIAFMSVDAAGDKSGHITSISANFQRLTAVRVSQLSQLQTLYVGINLIANLSVSNLPLLRELNVRNNKLSELDMTGLVSLLDVSLDFNLINSLSVVNLPQLLTLRANNNRIQTIHFSGASNLVELYIENNLIKKLDIRSLTNLTNLTAENNQISDLNIENIDSLTEVNLSFNKLTYFNGKDLLDLLEIQLDNNPLAKIEIKSTKFFGISMKNCAVSDSEQIDRLIIHIARQAEIADPMRQEGFITMNGGTNAKPTTASANARANLALLNWTIITN